MQVRPVISRVGVVAKPLHTHPKFQQWETARIVALVEADNREGALARALLAKHHFELLDIELCDSLIDERVREQGGEFLELYELALSGRDAIKVFPQNFGAGISGIPAIRPPRVTEEFIDLVVSDVGGERIATDEVNRKADYRIRDWIFELKDLQEEGLERPERQRKLADLFAPYAGDGQPVILDLEVLNDRDRRKFFDVIGSPIQRQVKSASKQIRATKAAIGDSSLHGGLIYLNTGYGSFPQEDFGPAVDRYVRKDTTQIEAVFCVSTWAVTNGFDSNIYFRTHPDEPQQDVIRELKEAFAKQFEVAMTQLVQGSLPSDVRMATPLTPVAFRLDGLDFSWMPPTIPFPWAKED